VAQLEGWVTKLEGCVSKFEERVDQLVRWDRFRKVGKVLNDIKGETPIYPNRQVMQRQTCTR
jgi:hypothetical protein